MVLVSTLISSSALADRCINQAIRAGDQLMKLNREEYKSIEVDSIKKIYDNVNTDTTIYRLTGRDKKSDASTLTYQLVFNNDGCLLIGYKLLGGN
jgi:hypothetical protein